MSDRPGSIWKKVELVVAGLVVAAVALATLRPERVLGPGRPIVLDDFAFSVVDCRAEPGPGPGERRLRVVLRVSNRAKRVAYRLRRSEVLLIAADGRLFRPAPAGSADPCSAPVPAGSSCETTLDYAVDARVADPRLTISLGPVGDALETIVFGRQSIRLEPAKPGGR